MVHLVHHSLRNKKCSDFSSHKLSATSFHLYSVPQWRQVLINTVLPLQAVSTLLKEEIWISQHFHNLVLLKVQTFGFFFLLVWVSLFWWSFFSSVLVSLYHNCLVLIFTSVLLRQFIVWKIKFLGKQHSFFSVS